jgi:hypothetical protein
MLEAQRRKLARPAPIKWTIDRHFVIAYKMPDTWHFVRNSDSDILSGGVLWLLESRQPGWKNFTNVLYEWLAHIYLAFVLVAFILICLTALLK